MTHASHMSSICATYVCNGPVSTGQKGLHFAMDDSTYSTYWTFDMWISETSQSSNGAPWYCDFRSTISYYHTEDNQCSIYTNGFKHWSAPDLGQTVPAQPPVPHRTTQDCDFPQHKPAMQRILYTIILIEYPFNWNMISKIPIGGIKPSKAITSWRIMATLVVGQLLNQFKRHLCNETNLKDITSVGAEVMSNCVPHRNWRLPAD